MTPKKSASPTIGISFLGIKSPIKCFPQICFLSQNVLLALQLTKNYPSLQIPEMVLPRSPKTLIGLYSSSEAAHSAFEMFSKSDFSHSPPFFGVGIAPFPDHCLPVFIKPFHYTFPSVTCQISVINLLFIFV